MNIQLSGNGTGIVVPKKTLLLFCIAGFIGLFTSCKKETVATPASQSASMLSADEAVARSTTNFGALISGNTNIDDEIKDIANELIFSGYVRSCFSEFIREYLLPFDVCAALSHKS